MRSLSFSRGVSSMPSGRPDSRVHRRAAEQLRANRVPQGCEIGVRVLERVAAKAGDEYIGQLRHRTFAAAAWNVTAHRKTLLERGTDRHECAKDWPAVQPRRGRRKRRARMDPCAFAPKQCIAAKDVESLSPDAMLIALARRGASETRALPTDESRITCEVDSRVDVDSCAVEHDRALRQPFERGAGADRQSQRQGCIVPCRPV